MLVIWMASNYWLLALNVVIAHGLPNIVGKVRGCFIPVKKQLHMDLCTCNQASTAGHPGMHNLMQKAQIEK